MLDSSKARRERIAAGLQDLSFNRIDNPTHKSPPPISQAANKSSAASRIRLQHLARRLHGLGPKPLFHFLDEVERGADLRPHLERYAALPADFIKANGGDRFVPVLHIIAGGSRS
jgi:hypothetical protein